MSQEMQQMWTAMKGVHYGRIMDDLKQNIDNAQEIQEGITLALDAIVNASHAVAGTFWFYEKYVDGYIRAKGVYGGANLSGIQLLPGEGIAGAVIKTGDATYIEDCQKDKRWAGRVDDSTGFTTRTMICVPLAMWDITFGCVQLINRSDNMFFDDADMELCTQMADTAANLFRENGFLEDYRNQGRMGIGGRREITFAQIFACETVKEMEIQFRALPQFSALRVTEQEAVLKLAREMYPYFMQKNRRRFLSDLFGG